MIYIDEHIWDFDLLQAVEQVSGQRREYAQRYRRELDQRLSIAAYRLLWHALRLEYGINDAPVFFHGIGGKPLLQGHPDIHFSLSHCREAVACAVSDSPVGIDIETTDQYEEELARRVMNDDEMNHILTSSSPAVAFTRLWTMKESLYKLEGEIHPCDIPHFLDHTDDYHFTTLVHPNCVTTLCSKG